VQNLDARRRNRFLDREEQTARHAFLDGFESGTQHRLDEMQLGRARNDRGQFQDFARGAIAT